MKRIHRYYDSKRNRQITIQPTHGRGKQKGDYEVIEFDLNRGIGGRTLTYAQSEMEALRFFEAGNFGSFSKIRRGD